MAGGNHHVWPGLPELGLELLIWLDVHRCESVLDVLDQWVIVEELVVELDQLVLVVLDLRAVPLVLVGVFEVPALGVGVDADLQVLPLVRVCTGGGNGVLDDFEALVGIVVRVEEGPVDASSEGCQALLGGSHRLLDGLRELDVRFMNIEGLRWWTTIFLLLLLFYGQLGEVHRVHIYDQVESAELDLRARFLAAIEDIDDQFWQRLAGVPAVLRWRPARREGSLRSRIQEWQLKVFQHVGLVHLEVRVLTIHRLGAGVEERIRDRTDDIRTNSYTLIFSLVLEVDQEMLKLLEEVQVPPSEHRRYLVVDELASRPHASHLLLVVPSHALLLRFIVRVGVTVEAPCVSLVIQVHIYLDGLVLEIAEVGWLGVEVAEFRVRRVEVDELHGHGAEGVLGQLAEHSVQGLVEPGFELVLLHVLADVV